MDDTCQYIKQRWFASARRSHDCAYRTCTHTTPTIRQDWFLFYRKVHFWPTNVLWNFVRIERTTHGISLHRWYHRLSWFLTVHFQVLGLDIPWIYSDIGCHSSLLCNKCDKGGLDVSTWSSQAVVKSMEVDRIQWNTTPRQHTFISHSRACPRRRKGRPVKQNKARAKQSDGLPSAFCPLSHFTVVVTSLEYLYNTVLVVSFCPFFVLKISKQSNLRGIAEGVRSFLRRWSETTPAC